MAGGRPRMYQSPEEMQVLIDRYFVECEGEILLLVLDGASCYLPASSAFTETRFKHSEGDRS